MKVEANHIGKFARIDPPQAQGQVRNVHLSQGAQIVRIPPNSTIRGLTLQGGGSCESAWANLSGAVLKFQPGRSTPVHITGNGLTLPTAFTLMDEGNFEITRGRNDGDNIPHRVITDLAAEKLYLVHDSYCHPTCLFLPRGTYTRALFSEGEINIEHMSIRDNILYLLESALEYHEQSINILAGLRVEPKEIIVRLREGGLVHLWRR